MWDLHEWISYLTPTIFGKHRFDAAFYITFLNNLPRVVADKTEMSGLQVMWMCCCVVVTEEYGIYCTILYKNFTTIRLHIGSHLMKFIHDVLNMCQVSTPQSILEKWREGVLALGPPQLYELNRLLNFKHYEDLKNFAETRGRKGMDNYLGVVHPASDGNLFLLPGGYGVYLPLHGEVDGCFVNSTVQYSIFLRHPFHFYTFIFLIDLCKV